MIDGLRRRSFLFRFENFERMEFNDRAELLVYLKEHGYAQLLEYVAG